jgi:hypothetical protein
LELKICDPICETPALRAHRPDVLRKAQVSVELHLTVVADRQAFLNREARCPFTCLICLANQAGERAKM